MKGGIYCLLLYKMAAGLGFEPSLADPESAVLPLDDPATFAIIHYHTMKSQLQPLSKVFEGKTHLERLLRKR